MSLARPLSLFFLSEIAKLLIRDSPKGKDVGFLVDFFHQSLLGNEIKGVDKE